MLLRSLHAELLKLAKRPAHWMLLAIGVLLGATFTYVIPYAGYASTDGDEDEFGARGLPAMLPDQLVGNALAGLPVFLGAIVLIFGVLAVAGEYGWGTWKTVLTQGPSRLIVYSGKLLAVAIGALVFVLATFAMCALGSMLIANAESQPIAWPSLADMLTGIGAGWLIALMWAVLGGLLGIALRSVALPIGLGLVWLLAVQNLLAGIGARLVDLIADVQRGLPGPNAGSLAAALGATSDTPGVEALVPGGRAALVIAAYLLVFAISGAILLRRRDIG